MSLHFGVLLFLFVKKVLTCYDFTHNHEMSAQNMTIQRIEAGRSGRTFSLDLYILAILRMVLFVPLCAYQAAGDCHTTLDSLLIKMSSCKR